MGEALKGKAAVVTGAGRGLGRAFALALAEEGASLVVNDLGTEADGSGRAAAPADETVAEIRAAGGEATANYDSVTTPEGGQNIIDTCIKDYGKIDILVNNAGILRDRMIFNMKPEEWDDVIKVHLYGTFNCSRPATSSMRRQGSGRIINVASPTALNGNPGQSNYGAAKAGILGFTRVIARELGGYGITANTIVPMAATRMTASLKAPSMPPPEDNAALVVFLASEAAAGINGQTLSCSGGRISLLSAAPVTLKSILKEGRWTFEELLESLPVAFGDEISKQWPPEQHG